MTMSPTSHMKTYAWVLTLRLCRWHLGAAGVLQLGRQGRGHLRHQCELWRLQTFLIGTLKAPSTCRSICEHVIDPKVLWTLLVSLLSGEVFEKTWMGCSNLQSLPQIDCLKDTGDWNLYLYNVFHPDDLLKRREGTLIPTPEAVVTAAAPALSHTTFSLHVSLPLYLSMKH